MSIAAVIGAGAKGGESTLLVGDAKVDNFCNTPASVTVAALAHPFVKNLLPVGTTIHECACGSGAISRVLADHSYGVISTNINNRGYGETGIDFLKTAKRRADVIFTNPPFKAVTGSAEDFLFHAGKLRVMVLIMILKTNYAQAGDEKVGRPWLNDPRWRPSFKLECDWRPDWTGEGASPMDFAVFGWVRPGQTGRPQVTKWDILKHPKRLAMMKGLL